MKYLHQHSAFTCMFILMLIIGLLPIAKAQQTSLLQKLSDEEQNAVEAIALYPEEQRLSILEASAHPEILVRIQSIQRNTESQFREILQGLPEEDQKMIFNLSRYPELIQTLCLDRIKKSRSKVEKLSASYPEEIRQQAIDANGRYFNTLLQINDLYDFSDQALNDILNPYPQAVKDAYQELLKLPEVMQTLSDNVSMTVLLGDLYKRQPEQLKKELDSLNVVVAEQKAKELNDWKQSLENDPDAMEEYEQAAREFARDQGYNETDYEQPIPAKYTTEVYVYNIWRPYPYWFGWPWWYSYDCWYPYPWWYHWGYYYGPGNVIVFVGLPSGYFVHWHFNHHRHLYYYPHFTNRMITYYNHNRTANTSVGRGVRQFEEQTHTQLTPNWLDNDANRVERIKEYGKLSMDYQARESNLNNAIDNQYEYLRNNEDKYPALKPVVREQPVSKVIQPQGQYRPESLPSVTPSQTREKIIQKQPSKYQEIDRANDFHQNSWERTKVQPQQTEPNRQPEPPKNIPQRTQPAQKVPQQTPVQKKQPQKFENQPTKK